MCRRYAAERPPGLFVHRRYALPIERKSFPALDAYYERLMEREPFREWIVGQGV